MLMKQTGDKTADFLIANLRFARRVGDHEHRRDADRWERIIREHAQPEEAMAVNFATSAPTPQPAAQN
jgi:hypothetical protein